jgi:hypothetical protein
MPLYKTQTRWLLLVAAPFVAVGLQFFVFARSGLIRFLPICLACLGILTLMLPHKRRLEINLERNELLIHEGSRSRSVSLERITEILVDDEDIIVKTDADTTLLFHSDFNSYADEKRFLDQLRNGRKAEIG